MCASCEKLSHDITAVMIYISIWNSSADRSDNHKTDLHDIRVILKFISHNNVSSMAADRTLKYK